MKRPTTLQFRQAVRQVAKLNNFTIYDSYTNGGIGGGLNKNKAERTVGFHMQGANSATALAVENELAKFGLSAKTRATHNVARFPNSVRTNFGLYIRGSCLIK